MNPILVRIVAGEYGAGWAQYAAMEAPTSDDDRFAALCLFNLQEFQHARDLLLRALARGCSAAGIELATV